MTLFAKLISFLIKSYPAFLLRNKANLVAFFAIFVLFIGFELQAQSGGAELDAVAQVKNLVDEAEKASQSRRVQAWQDKSNSFSMLDHKAVELALSGKYEQALAMALLSPTQETPTLITWLEAMDKESDMSKLDRLRFIKENPDWPGQKTIQAIAERRPLLIADLNAKQLVSYYEKYEPEKNSEYMGYINAIIMTGDTERANQMARKIWRTRTFVEKDELAFLDRFGDIITQVDQVERMKWLLANDHAVSGERQIERLKITTDYPFYRAQLALLQGSNLSRKEEQSLTKSQRQHYKIMKPKIKAEINNDRLDKALEYFFEMDASTVSPDTLLDLRLLLARIAISHKKYEQAYKVLRGHGATSGENFSHAEWLMGWLTLRQLKRSETAIEHFNIALNGADDRWKAKTLFWLATTYAGANKPVLAVRAYGSCARYVFDLHGQLCLKALGYERFEGDFSRPMDRAQSFPSYLTAPAALLANAGEWSKASMFLYAIRSKAKSAEQQRQLITFAQALGLQNLSYILADQFLYVGADVWNISRPILDLELEEQIERHEDRAIFYALMFSESSFRTKVVSKAGAMGLAQLLPDTAKDIARRNNIELNSKQDLLNDPKLNARLGWHYIQWIQEQVGNRWIYVLPAYNAGHARVKEWHRRFGEADNSVIGALDWIEHVPYRETRDYIVRVIENASIYDSLLVGKAQPFIASDLLMR